MKTLNLDLGTTTGWAACDEQKVVASGTVSFANRRFEGGGMRFLRFKAWLDDYLKLCPDLAAVYFEEVHRHAGTDAAHIYGGLMAILTSWCESNKVPYSGVSVGTIKKHATGKGNANKDAMIEAAKDKGHSPKDDNEADAICLAYCTMDGMGEKR